MSEVSLGYMVRGQPGLRGELQPAGATDSTECLSDKLEVGFHLWDHLGSRRHKPSSHSKKRSEERPTSLDSY